MVHNALIVAGIVWVIAVTFGKFVLIPSEESTWKELLSGATLLAGAAFVLTCLVSLL